MQKFLFALIVLIGLSAFTVASQPGDGYFKINTTASSIKWNAKKVTGQHHGSITVKDGTLQIQKSKLVGGSFTIDMASIKVLDLQGEMAGKLEGHLKSDDFFNATTFPSATLIILEAKETSKENYNIKANLTIRGITKAVEFPAVVKTDGKKYNASANITVDRSQFDVKYGSGSFYDNLGDKTIYDNFDLAVSLVAE